VDPRKKMEEVIGGVWHGVSFFDSEPDFDDDVYVGGTIRFCEAVAMAGIQPVVIPAGRLGCPGACYVFGCEDNPGEGMFERLVERGYSEDCITGMIAETPRLKECPVAIGIDVDDNPAILIAALQPQETMALVHLYEKNRERPFACTLSGFASICGGVAARACKTGDVALSFGCEQSRVFGGIRRDRLIAGVPSALVEAWFATGDPTRRESVIEVRSP
jgi:uncharacterized protein (DUF169 family)